MALPAIMRRLFAGDGYGPLLKDDVVSKRISIQDWLSSFDYQPATAVRGSNGRLYWSLAQSGPGTSAGAVDPVTDSGVYWVLLPSQADVASYVGSQGYATQTWVGSQGYTTQADVASYVGSQGYATQTWVGSQGYTTQADVASYIGSQGYALDSNVVHKTGNETIGGVKTFSDSIYGNQRCVISGVSTAPARITVRSLDLSSSEAPETTKSFGLYVITDKIDRNVYTSEVDFDTEKVIFRQNIYSGGEFRNSITFDYEFAHGYRSFYPYYTGLVSLGTSTNLWKDVWSSTGAIQTSDERLKKSINPIPDDILDAWGEVGFFQFQFNDAFAEKGASARLHSGLVAQRIDEAFRSHGLDASRYGLFCHDKWESAPERRDADGKIIEPAREAGDAFSLRYEEALCMEAAYQRRRADRAEARIASLEARLAALEAKLNG